MNFVVPDFYPAAAEIFVAVMALVIMLASTFARSIARNLSYFLTQATLIGAALITIYTMEGEVVHTFSNMFISDLMGDFLKLMIYFSTAIALLYGRGYLADRKIDKPEYYLLALLMTLGMMVMVTANHMLPMYIGLEMMSLALYTMVAFDRDSSRSTEAAMKYFVLGALASGLLLYGMSMVYGATGTLEFSAIAQSIYNQSANQTVLMFGLVFLVAGICFKLGVVPFHMWVPDVYQGAPTAVTLLIATAPKLAAFAMAVRLLIWALFDVAAEWQVMLMMVAGASIVLGNLAAIAQQNIKRMLAYSGISHMGFMLLGLLAGVVEGDRHFALNAYSSAMFYAVSYVIMSLASFGMIILLSRAGFEAENIDDFKGLNKRSPWFALMMLFVMFSMAGVPFFIGFFAKLSVLQAVVAAGYFWLAVLAVVMSVIGAFYYLRVVKLMYFDEPVDASPIHAPAEVRVMLSANGLAIAALGLAPQMLMSVCAYALLGSL
ncbi:NADH-quinone oxidoreductase subunit NuoN [Thauera sp.]|jgi:NADH-quinone oxidoreductase subunit N|uniref:NADH-quinone oxidoreductase subunit NuoN n=1 Tax=Thauera sp. TaxID=1905334 RepID=UPI002A36FB26|nr:NADH-quinone oxidoreductase subunit NuoN [Thauera sp.]MDX9884845.1 NADH-quinone oxidoreductase subunit NuoN [Thauera sp.]